MLNWIITFSLKNRLLVCVLAAALAMMRASFFREQSRESV